MAHDDLPIHPASNRSAGVNPPSRSVRDMSDIPTESWEGDYGMNFPNSRKVFVEAHDGIRVPMREIHLSGGEEPLRVYDTSGPRDIDVHRGIPKTRAGWIRERGSEDEPPRVQEPVYACYEHVTVALNHNVLRSTGGAVTQMAYARRGEITPEMDFVALREGVEPEFVRSEVARGRAIIPANINHPEIEPMIIGRNFKVKINANIGNSAVSHPLGCGHRHGPLHREEHPPDPPVDPAEFARPHRHRAHLPGAGEGGWSARGTHLGDLPGDAHRAG